MTTVSTITSRCPESGNFIENSVRCLNPTGFHRMAYVSFGEPQGIPVVCVHGLARNGRDFDWLARALADEGRWVICPDVVGRGKSDFLPDASLYTYPQYLADMTVLLARLNVETVDWVGTSMGGLIGMMLAAQPKTPLRRLVMNDIGPEISQAALARIGSYVGVETHFNTVAEAEAELRVRYKPFGITQDEDWAAFTATSLRALPEGGYSLAYDPKIAEVFKSVSGDMNLWPLWERVTCPVQVLRGAESDLLLPEVAQRMTPKAQLATILGCGHAPALIDPVQIKLVANFLA